MESKKATMGCWWVSFWMLRLFFLSKASVVEGILPFYRNHYSILVTSRLQRQYRVVGHLSWHSSSSSGDETTRDLSSRTRSMENLYQEWTMEQDRQLWENYQRQPSIAVLAAMMGRGLRGVEKRLAKLKDVNSSAYQRLFAGSSPGKQEQEADRTKLIPVSEVIRRIRYDVSLPSDMFSVLFYDRVEDAVVETALMAPNTSVKGPQALLVDALPEHRIVAIKYLERVVWEREKRLDLVFAGPGIKSVIELYDEWKQDRDAALERQQQRQNEITLRIQQAIGALRFEVFKELAASLQSASRDPTISVKIESEKFVQSALELFQQAREIHSSLSPLDPAYVLPSDSDALNLISELIALHPDEPLRLIVLAELSHRMAVSQNKSIKSLDTKLQLPELDEKDITERFVRGSGPGGQKINKTSNKVVLVHEPTQLRVECQETRSLQQNRKIARKRLQLKLDEYLHGSQSRERVKAQKAAERKNKAKARSRARQRRKQTATEDEVTDSEGEIKG